MKTRLNTPTDPEPPMPAFTPARVLSTLVTACLALVYANLLLQREIERMEGVESVQRVEAEEDAARYASPANRHYSRACITCETIVRDDAGNIIDTLPPTY